MILFPWSVGVKDNRKTLLCKRGCETCERLSLLFAIAPSRWCSPTLTEFIHVSANNIRPQQYERCCKILTLEKVRVGFGCKKKNQEFEER